MRVLSLFFCSLLAVVSAYQIMVPNAVQGWTNQGSQTLTWQRVNTDPVNFTVVLINQDPSLYPSPGYSQVLDALVDGSLGTTQVNPPSGGWPTGGSFRVNFVRDAQSLSTILAQSNMFNITAANGSSTTLSSAHGTTVVVPPTTASSTDTGTASPAFTNTNGASRVMSGGMLGLVGIAVTVLLG